MPPIAPAPSGTVTITARLRDSEPTPDGKAPFREDGAQQVYAIDTAQIAGAAECSADRVLSAAGRRPAGRPRRDRPAPSGRGAVPVLRHPVDRVRHPCTDRAWATSPFPRSGRADGREPPRQNRPADRAAHRPRRSSPTATASGADRHRRRHRARALHHPRQPHRADADRRLCGAAPSPRVGRISSSCAYCVGPPSRTPSAPANAASTTPALGLGCRAASRRHARTAPDADPPTTGAQTTTSAPSTRAAT